MQKHKILIVDDEPSIREFLAQILSEHYQILFAKNGTEALEVAKSKVPTIILLDILMPGKNGIQTCRDIRNDPTTKSIPVIMLTALNDTDQRTQAFISGADDYVSKPFTPDELVARIESKIRRQKEVTPQIAGRVQFGDLTLNLEELKAEINGKAVEISQTEFKILNCLIKNQGQLLLREALHDYVWGDESPSDRALDPHITTLRKKLKGSRCELKTAYGQGYSLILKESAV